MLGIRKHRGAQIDLHQGDPSRFACDALVREGAVTSTSTSAPGSLPAKCLIEVGGETGKAVRDALSAADAFGARHVVIPALGLAGSTSEASAAASLTALRAFLDSFAVTPEAVRRVTFALSTSAHYAVFGEAMARTFPEAEPAHTLGSRPRPAPGVT